MNNRHITPIDEQRQFEPHELFFSLTDRKGVIQYGNDVFTRISGYSEEDLLGQPHNIIRHPDMPRAVFKLLWDYLEAGRSIAAYVKNMAKDGRYYWVLATVVPTPNGYLSIRLKPSSPLFDAVEQVYKDALKVEREVERETGNRKTAMEASLTKIVESLNSAGFDDYDQFMSEALSQELTAREEWMSHSGFATPGSAVAAGSSPLISLENSCDVLSGMLKTLFTSLGAFKNLGTELANKYELIQELGPSLQFLALNARMAASRLGDAGIVQAAVADALGGKSKQAEATINALVKRMEPLTESLAQLVFDIAVARFEAEVSHSFANELRGAGGGSESPQVIQSLSAVVNELNNRSRQVVEGMRSLDNETKRTQNEILDLIGRIVEMKAIQLNGKIEAAGSGAKSDFSVIFAEASRYIEGGRKDCDVLLEVLGTSAERIDEFKDIEPDVTRELRTLQESASAVTGTNPTNPELTPA